MRSSSWIALVVAVLLLAACGAPLGQTGEPGLVQTAATALPGAHFLPPVGPSVDTTVFFDRATVEFKFLALDGAAAGTYLAGGFSTANGTVRVEDEFYLALWRVADTAAAAPGTTTVRVEAWAGGLEGAPVADECADPDECLVGWFDAKIRPNRSSKSDGDVIDVTRARTVPVKLFVMGPDFRPERLSELRPLSSSVTFDDVGPNCTVNEFNMPGQGVNALGAGVNALGAGVNALGAGVNALGAVGGLFLLSSDAPEPGDPQVIRLLEPSEAGMLANGLVRNDLIRNAAILIVDDFGWAFTIDGALTSPDPGLELADLQALVDGGGFSHGALVMHQTVEMLTAAGFVPDNTRPWVDQGDFLVFERAGAEGSVSLVLATVDTNGLNTDAIPGRIQNALNALRLYGFLDDGVVLDRAAINMSFVILPCSVLDDFDLSALADFEGYVAALEAENDVADGFDLAELLVRPLPNAAGGQPLLEQIQCFQQGEAGFELDLEDEYYLSWWFLVNYGGEGEGQFDVPLWGCGARRSTIYVASSGNFGLDYPMYPAAWQEVVGVSSRDAAEPDGFASVKSGFSNDGGIMAPGAVYLLGASKSDDADPRVVAIGYAGTSFAAPVVSLFTALDLMEWARCDLQTTSRLTWADDRANEPLGDAVENYCWEAN